MRVKNNNLNFKKTDFKKWLLGLLPIQFKICCTNFARDIAAKGEEEDCELAHINKFEAQLLKELEV